MDSATGLIIDYSLVQVIETGTSVGMEKEGSLATAIEDLNLNVATLATDRHCQIAAFMRTEYPSINHQFDAWHSGQKCHKESAQGGAPKGS